MAAANPAPSVIDYALQLAAGSAAALALSFGGDPAASNRTGFYGDLTAAAEKVRVVAGGVTGPYFQRNASTVDAYFPGAVTISSLSTGRITTAGASGLLQDFAGYILAGTMSGTAPSSATNGPTTVTNGPVIQAVDGGQCIVVPVSFGNGSAAASGMIGYVAQGTAASPSPPTTTDLVLLGLRGHDGTGYTTARASITFAVGSLWTSINHETNIQFGVTASGATAKTTVLTLKTTGSIYTVPVLPGSGSISAPSFAFSTDTTTGAYRVSSGVVGIVCAGTERFRFGANQFVVNQNANAIGTGATGSVGSLTFHGVDSSQASIAICGYAALPTLFFRRSEGTGASPSQTTSGISLGQLAVEGYEVTTPGFTAQKTAWLAISTEAFTSTANGFRQDFFVIANGATAVARCIRFDQDGNVLIGTVTNGMTAAGSLAIAQDLAHRGTKIGLFNTAPIAQKTGYGTPTGNAYQASFAAGSITLPNLAAAVAQLILDLKAYGQIGA